MAGTQSKQWVLMAAGSHTYINYRHQANVCHAYHMVHNNGIPDEQVVVMMYDDIANNKKNPKKGEIINEPNGPNVYEGVLKDYTEADVSVHNFLAVLRGDKTAVVKQRGGPKKVLNSGKKDKIFIYLSGHGNKGLFAFPKERLYACDLLETVQEMAYRQQFSEMVIYIESCYSGSMLEHLPSNVQVYGVSAADPNHPHYACYYDKERHAYIAGEFSAHWLLHCKKTDLTKTTFQDQFQYLRSQVKRSTPCQYGNNGLTKRFISDFLGCPDSRTRAALARTVHTFEPTDLIASHEVPLVLLNKKIEKERDPMRKRALQRDYDNRRQKRERIEMTVHAIASHARTGQNLRAGGSFEGPSPMTHLRNMKEVEEHFRLTFRELHEEQEDVTFLLHHIHVFDDLLRARAEVHRIKDAITHVYSTQGF